MLTINASSFIRFLDCENARRHPQQVSRLLCTLIYIDANIGVLQQCAGGCTLCIEIVNSGLIMKHVSQQM